VLRPHLAPLICALVMAAAVSGILMALPTRHGAAALSVGIPAGVLIFGALTLAVMPDRLRRLWNALRHPTAAAPAFPEVP
jgi:hypothetical protein